MSFSHPFGRPAVALASLISTFLVVAPVLTGVGAALFLVMLPFALLPAASAYFLMYRPRLVIDECRVLVVQPLRQIDLPTESIAFASGEGTLRLHPHTGEEVTVWAVQSANITILLGREGRADRVAREINHFLVGVHASAADGNHAEGSSDSR